LLTHWFLLLLACAVWAFAHWIASGNLDAYHDMLEAFAWGQPLVWGTFKHPPMTGWATALWFSVLPQNDLSFRLLAFTNVWIGLAGVICLGRWLGLRWHGPQAALLLLLSLPYTTLAAKFNANSQLLSLWPWTAVLFMASWRTPGWRGLAAALGLGVLGAASMLAKYYSGVFLLGLVLALLAQRDGWRWFLTPRPYLALATFAVALAPHALWVFHHDFITLRYADDQGGGDTQWRQLFKFVFAPLFYWLPGWLACTGAVAWQQDGLRRWPRLAVLSWRPQGARDLLFWLAVMPWAITLVFGLTGVVALSTPWAIPIGFAFPLLWLRNLVTASAPENLRQTLARQFAKLIMLTLPAVLLLAAAAGWHRARSADADYYRPSAAAARDIVRGWQARHPTVPLEWVGGAWAENVLVEFYAAPVLRTLPGFPGEFPATVSPFDGWEQRAGLLLCPLGPVQAGTDVPATPCDAQARAWLATHAMPAVATTLNVARTGWQFPLQVNFAYRLYDFVPGTPSPGQP
jgi:4-amino-4-deoxy-L-arabinose transferase-like glycosyltransferase